MNKLNELQNALLAATLALEEWTDWAHSNNRITKKELTSQRSKIARWRKLALKSQSLERVE